MPFFNQNNDCIFNEILLKSLEFENLHDIYCTLDVQYPLMRRAEAISYIMAAGLILNSCRQTKSKDISSPETSTSWQFGPSDSPRSVIERYYPEVSHLPVRQEGKIITTRTTEYINFSNIYFDADAAASIYTFLENPKNLGIDSGLEINYTDGNSRRWLLNVEDLPPRDRLLVIVPQGYPTPSWLTKQGQPKNLHSGMGETEQNVHGQNAPTETIIAIPATVTLQAGNGIFSTVGEIGNRFFNTEACQATLAIVPGKTPQEQSNPQDQSFVQEIFCNSLGIAMAASELDLNFNQYTKATQSTKLISGQIQHPLIIVPEKIYKTFPKKPAIR